MAKVCRICGKKILGDVFKHYQEEHFSLYAANSAKIQACPSAFVVSEENYDAKNAERINTSKTKSKKASLDDHKFDKKKMSEAHNALLDHPSEQTYRDNKEFKCDACGKFHIHGKIIFVNRYKTLHLCYKCYKHAKANVESKRGNRHVVILTPMK